MDQIGSPEHISSSWLESISYAGGVTKTCVFMQRPIGDYLVEDDDKWSWDLDVVIRWMSISMKSRVICIFGENHNWLMQVSINNLQHKKWILIKNPWVTWMFLFSLSVNWLTVVNIKVSALNSITNWPPSPPVAPTRQLKLQIRSRYFQCTLDAILCIPQWFAPSSLGCFNSPIDCPNRLCGVGLKLLPKSINVNAAAFETWLCCIAVPEPLDWWWSGRRCSMFTRKRIGWFIEWTSWQPPRTNWLLHNDDALEWHSFISRGRASVLILLLHVPWAN